MRSELRTCAYVARRTAEGLSTKEIQRCLKRYIVRELYPLILADLADAACDIRQRSVNAAMESFFSTLKIERINRKQYATRDEARADVFDYVERFYNPRRRHSTLGYLSPIDYE